MGLHIACKIFELYWQWKEDEVLFRLVTIVIIGQKPRHWIANKSKSVDKQNSSPTDLQSDVD